VKIQTNTTQAAFSFSLAQIDTHQYLAHLCHKGQMTYWVTSTNKSRLEQLDKALGMNQLPEQSGGFIITYSTR
jgi:hypothetical protein